MTDAVASPIARQVGRSPSDILRWAIALAVWLAALYLASTMYRAGQVEIGVLTLVISTAGVWVYTSARAYVFRYLFPGLAGIAVFILFPLVFTTSIAFTNYSASNLLTFERARAYFLDQSYLAEAGTFAFALHGNPDAPRLVLTDPDDGTVYASPPLTLDGSVQAIRLEPIAAPEDASEALSRRAVVQNRQALGALTVTLPTGRSLVMSGLRAFAARAPRFTLNDDGSLTDNQQGGVLTPNPDTGFFETRAGEPVSPGYRVGIGWQNYIRTVTDSGVSGPFVQIFIWNVAFALLSVLLSFVLGFVLANLMQWEKLRFRGLYRLFLILPYAVPGFISILVFRGLFNQEFGEINLLLEALVGIKPRWFTDVWLARTMLVIVNVWLGFPYMMILAMGLLQAVPKDLYEASAIDGAGPIANTFRITLPTIITPFWPLLISSFAFNFNNFVIIRLLTDGRPDILGASTPAGSNDLLASYTYRIAFLDSGQDFGLASAIATLIFLMVAAIALVQLKLVQKAG